MSAFRTQPRLYVVPAAGTLAERATARRLAHGVRQILPYPAYDETTPGQAAADARSAYERWGVAPHRAGTLAELAHSLTAHTLTVLGTHRVLVTSALDHGRATVSVLARDGRVKAAAEALAPDFDPTVRALADTFGWVAQTAGPCLYATAAADIDQPAD